MWRWTIGLLLAAGCGGDGDDTSPKDEDTQPAGDDDDGNDVDGDGFDADEDCDDTNGGVHPGADEAPYDGLDNDCADGDLVDVDEDGFDAVQAGGDDCDDTDPEVHPGVEEIPYDGIDQDCADGDLIDVDGDGHGGDDCDDNDPTIFPGAEETYYDGVDQDCRADCDYDADHDRAVPEEWLSAVTDGSACDRDPSAEANAPIDCNDRDRAASTQHVISTIPVDGAVDVDAMGMYYVQLADPEFNARLRLLDADGNEYPSGWYPETADRFVLYGLDPVTYSGPFPLPGFVEWTIETTHSCGTETFSFTTGEGLGPVDPNELVGTAFEVAVGTGYGWPNWAVVNFFNLDKLGFLAIDGTDGTNLDVVFAPVNAAGTQDLCVPTGEIRGLDFSDNPSLFAAPFDYPISYTDNFGGIVNFINQQGSIRATIFGDQLLAVTLRGFVETTSVAVASGNPPNSVCNMWGCVACPDGSGQTCYEQEFQVFGDMRASGQTIVPRTAEEIAVDPGCP